MRWRNWVEAFEGEEHGQMFFLKSFDPALPMVDENIG